MATSIDLTWLAMERVRYESLFDSDTELPRWGLFLDRTAVALERAESGRSGVAVFILDEPHLPGDEHGDIRKVAERLRSRLRPGDTLARLGDERFAVMCDVFSDADAANVARHLIYDSGLVCELGIALSQTGDVPETLIGRALMSSTPREVDPVELRPGATA